MLTREHQIVADQIKELLDLLPLLNTLQNQVDDKPRDLDFLVDTAYLCRKTTEILDATKKAVERLGAKAENQTCMTLAVISESKHSTENATASPNPDFYVKFPSSPEKEGFVAFVQQLPLEAVRPHYPTVEQLITEELHKGNQIPFGLPANEIAGCTFKLRILSKKEL